MINDKMYELGTKKSTIRTIFEFGRQRALEVGEDNIFDFSLGNPNVPTPQFIKDAILDILDNPNTSAVHGYTVAPGNPQVRQTIAQSINQRFNTNYEGKNIFITAGAAAAITISFKALCESNDEFITFAPYFPEYKCFVESVGGKLIVVPAQVEDFQINFDEFVKRINKNTKAIIINSPNNPSGAVYSQDTIQKLADILNQKSKEFGKPIFIISDEPYREIAYDVDVPYVPNFYPNTLVCYSFSKSFSIPGERIGYIVVPNEIADFNKIFGSIAGAARILTHVNAPSLWQLVIAKCAGKPSDISIYRKNAQLLYEGLINAGFTCNKPQGAFYLFPKCLESDDYAFCDRAKKYDLLLVPGNDFGCPGYFRIAYCVKTETVERALPLFKKLAEEYV